jgi:hypothetical protein
MSKPDLAAFDALRRTNHPTKCKVGRILDELSEQERVNLEAALAMPKDEYPDALITRWCKERGHQVGGKSVSTHRSGDCVCP